jgi:hypothetical protein
LGRNGDAVNNLENNSAEKPTVSAAFFRNWWEAWRESHQADTANLRWCMSGQWSEAGG